MFKNIGKNVKSVAFGAGGVLIGDYVQHKLMHKIPMIGDKPMIRTAAVTALGLLVMDYQYEVGLGIAVSQAANMLYTVEKVASFVGHEHINGPEVLNGNVLSNTAREVIDGINTEIQDAINDFKSQNANQPGTLTVSLG